MPDTEGHKRNLSDADRLDALGEKLDAIKQTETPDVEPAGSRMGEGLKYASEFSAAVIVGAALGYAADKGLNSAPWGLLLGLIFGLGAGVLNIIRTSQETFETGDLGQDLPETDEE